MANQILIALQFWEGDKARAMELARFLADLEPVKQQQADFLFAARFDCDPDPATVAYVSRKFNVYTLKSKRQAIGWPDGCNELWFSVMEWVQSLVFYKKIPQYKAIFTCEADGAPIIQDWVNWLSLEWDRVNRPKPVCMAGALIPPIPGCTDRWHINGNALMSGNPKFLYWIARRIGGSRPGCGWDYCLAGDFQRIGWADVPGIKSIYNTPTFTPEQYVEMIKNQWVWIHGVKDTSLIRMGREKFRV
jgi:hypothetical protein